MIRGPMLLGALRYEIVYVPMIVYEGEPDSSKIGAFNARDSKLEIRADHCGPQQEAAAVLHESLHAMFTQASIPLLEDRADEEAVVTGLDPWFHAFIVQNPDLIRQVWEVAGVAPSA